MTARMPAPGFPMDVEGPASAGTEAEADAGERESICSAPGSLSPEPDPFLYLDSDKGEEGDPDNPEPGLP